MLWFFKPSDVFKICLAKKLMIQILSWMCMRIVFDDKVNNCLLNCILYLWTRNRCTTMKCQFKTIMNENNKQAYTEGCFMNSESFLNLIVQFSNFYRIRWIHVYRIYVHVYFPYSGFKFCFCFCPRTSKLPRIMVSGFWRGWPAFDDRFLL